MIHIETSFKYDSMCPAHCSIHCNCEPDLHLTCNYQFKFPIIGILNFPAAQSLILPCNTDGKRCMERHRVGVLQYVEQKRMEFPDWKVEFTDSFNIAE